MEKETPKQKQPEIYVLGGQKYRAILVSTMEHDFYLMRQLRIAGLSDPTPRADETVEAYGVRLLYALVDHGAPFELLGALVIPEDVPDETWAPEMAQRTARILAGLTGEKDKAEVQRLLVTLLMDFFREGLRYLTAFRTASTQAQTQPEAEPMQSEESSAINS